MFFIGLIIWGIICGAFCAYLAKQKNREPEAWFFLGLLFSLIALIAIAASPVQEIEKVGEFTCSECGADIIKGQEICPGCGVEIDWSEIEGKTK